MGEGLQEGVNGGGGRGGRENVSSLAEVADGGGSGGGLREGVRGHVGWVEGSRKVVRVGVCRLPTYQ